MKRLLIDAAHPEELRVLIADGTRIEDFEAETAGKAQLKGNIYIGHVSRVEPSLQAAFITYGGNRNGFLAFGEVHPQFFHLKKDEKTALLEELTQSALRRRGQEEADELDPTESPTEDTPTHVAELTPEETTLMNPEAALAESVGAEAPRARGRGPRREESRGRPRRAGAEGASTASEDKPRQPSIHRRYRIQDVLKEGQKILVQVVKEERGSKGAALTTYFSLPGRYTVLMPNTPAAGGISRKITDGDERRALRDAYAALDIPATMGLIIRTAGMGQEIEAIKQDYANLRSLWEHIQQEFESNDDIQCIHEDGSVIIRALRDMITDDIEDIVISGKRAYKLAKDYTKNLMPEAAKLIKEHKEDTPIFTHYKLESRLDSLHHSRVTLPSGGYMIINPTEALVAVDINSGRATQERNIEETAVKTNLEACEELARQIRLRDLAGLIVVDFIDMEDNRNNRKVENAMRKVLRKDRARIQCGNISDFGLMEISRQRLRPSFGESHFIACAHCNGSGLVHSPSTAALMILRHLEDDDCRSADRILVSTNTEQVLWLLNHKRDVIRELEAKWKYQLVFRADDSMIAPDHKLDLIRIKSDGTESTQTIAITLREQPELPPELRMQQKGREAGRERRERDDRKDDRRDEKDDRRPARREPDRDEQPEPRAAREDRPQREARTPREDRPQREDRKDRGRNRPERNRPERDGNTPRRPQRIGQPADTPLPLVAAEPEMSEKPRGRRNRPEGNSKPAIPESPAREARPERAERQPRAERPKPAAAPQVAEDLPLLVQKVAITALDDDTPVIIPRAPRKPVEIRKQADTDATDAPLQVQKLTPETHPAGDAPAKRPARKSAAKPAEASETDDNQPKKGSILARLIGRQ